MKAIYSLEDGQASGREALMKMPKQMSRRSFLGQTAAALAAPTILLREEQLAAAQARDAVDTEAPPNVVIIFADDQGYGDLGSYGSPLIKTPHLDQMAREGRRFTSFYSANSVCSPSRAALLTGCYPPRVSVPDVLWPHSRDGLSPDEITIADVLKERGYATACIGKWHLGCKPNMLPTRQGFDSYFGIPFSNDMFMDPTMKIAANIVLREGVTLERMRSEERQDDWVPLLRNDEVVEYPTDQETLTRRYTEAAVKFITDNQDKPFFLYFPHTMPHIPLFASDQFDGTSARGPYGDVIEEMDWSTGEILRTLKALDLDERTLVIYTSDNGPWRLSDGRGGSAGPLRGFKFQTYEGGMREPCIMRWPGKIPADTVSFEIAATIDLLPTIAALTGARLSKDRIIDGKNIWPLMNGTPGATTPHDAFYYYQGNLIEAVRSGKWKLRRSGAAGFYQYREEVLDSRYLGDAHPELYGRLVFLMDNFDSDSLRQLHADVVATENVSPQLRDILRRLVDQAAQFDAVELYDLQLDISESMNLADAHPDIVRHLLDTMITFDRDLKAHARPAGQWNG